jgi:hypothetical protein
LRGLRSRTGPVGALPLLCWLLLAGLAGCSPYDFSPEVGAFAAGVDRLSNGFASGYTALASDRAAFVRLELTRERARVAIASSCFAPPSQPRQDPAPCTLYRLGGAPPAPSGIERLHDRTMSLLAALQGYAHALAAVTNAADRAAYDAAVAQLASTVGALAQGAGPAGAGAGTVAPAAINLIGWLAGTALDQQRFESLKAGVTAAGTPLPNGEIPIDFVATAAGDGLYALSKERQAILIAEANALTRRIGPSLTDAAYREELSNAQGVLAALAALRHADPRAATAGLVKAHAALVAAVDDPSRNYPALLKAVGAFEDQAAALETALAAAGGGATAR